MVIVVLRLIRSNAARALSIPMSNILNFETER